MLSMKKMLLFVMALFVAGGFVSCDKFYDMRMNALERSIESLSQNYETSSSEKLQEEIAFCEEQFKQLSQKESELTDVQRRRLSNMKGRYHRILVEIKLWSLTYSIKEEGTEAAEYIKGLLGGE